MLRYRIYAIAIRTNSILIKFKQNQSDDRKIAPLQPLLFRPTPTHFYDSIFFWASATTSNCTFI